MAMISQPWTRVRTLGRGASGAEVLLAADDASGELIAVKSACASGAAALRREQAIMSALRSPRVVSCIGGCAGRDGSYQLFLEFAPGGSLANEAARRGGSLDEPTVRAYAADVARGLAYLHGESAHGEHRIPLSPHSCTATAVVAAAEARLPASPSSFSSWCILRSRFPTAAASTMTVQAPRAPPRRTSLSLDSMRLIRAPSWMGAPVSSSRTNTTAATRPRPAGCALLPL